MYETPYTQQRDLTLLAAVLGLAIALHRLGDYAEALVKCKLAVEIYRTVQLSPLPRIQSSHKDTDALDR